MIKFTQEIYIAKIKNGNTKTLLEVAKEIWGEGSLNKEVYGSLGETRYSTEKSQIKPNSPYSATKASLDLIALAYSETYKMNVTATNCSNNYGEHINIMKN